MSLNNSSASPWEGPSGSQSVPPRKKLLKAPSLTELDSSDSDVSMTALLLFFYFVLVLMMDDRHTIPQACAAGTNTFLMSCTPGWFCWAQINKQLQCGDIIDGWHVPRVNSWKEKYKKICYIVKTASLKLFKILLQSSWCFEVCIRQRVWIFPSPQQRPQCSCQYLRHPSPSAVRPLRGDIPLRRRLRPMCDSFSHPPNTALSLWWVFAVYSQSSAFFIIWVEPSCTAVQ